MGDQDPTGVDFNQFTPYQRDGKLVKPQVMVTPGVTSRPSIQIKNSAEEHKNFWILQCKILNDGNNLLNTAPVYWTPKPVKQKIGQPTDKDIWYDRFGGSSMESIEQVAKDNSTIKFTEKALSQTKTMQQSKSNMKAAPHSGQIPRVSEIGYHWWGDSQGPNVKSFIYHYVHVFGWLDDSSNYGIVTFGTHKSEALQSFKILKAKCPYQIRMITTDGANEYFSHELQSIALNSDITWSNSPAYIPQRNPRIEHWWYRTDLLARYMIGRFQGWRIFWAFAKSYAVLITNIKFHGPSKAIPYESFWKCNFDYGKLRVFGCTVAIRYMTTAARGTNQKYLEKSEWGFYLGFNADKWQHLCYGLDSCRLHEGPDFIPFETNFGAIWKFMGANQKLNTLPEEELKNIEAQPQGEKLVKEASLNFGPFGLSAKSITLWDTTAVSQDIDKNLPAEGPNNTEDEHSTSNQDTTTTTPEGEFGTGDKPISAEGEPHTTQPSTTPSTMNDGKSKSVNTQKSTQKSAPSASNNNLPTIPDTSANQMRALRQEPQVTRAVTRQAHLANPESWFDPKIPTADANYQVKDLAIQNQKMELIEKSGKQDHGEINFTNTSMHALVLLCATMEVTETQTQSWMNECEHAMHMFILECQHTGGYWEDVPIIPIHTAREDKKRTCGFNDSNAHARLHDKFHLKKIQSTGYAMPTMDGPEPRSRLHAKTFKDADQYEAATIKELNGHKENATWIACELPKGASYIDTKIVYVRKINPDDSLKHKARLVARGFTQVAGENFNWDTIFAPVIQMVTLRWLFSQIAEYNYEVTGSDVVQAFLQSELKDPNDTLKDIYIKLPEGCEETCPTTGKTLAYGRLQKALYGLKQAPRRWHEKLATVLHELGFITHPKDPSLFIYRRGKTVMYIGVYVDDLIKVTNDVTLRKSVDAILSKKLKIEHQGELTEYLGMELKWKIDSEGKRYFNVSQEKYTRKILKRFGLDECKSKDIPCTASGHTESIYMWPNPLPPEECDAELLARYRAGIGALIYLAVITRPDISYAVNAVSQFMSNPTKEHEQALWKIFRYLKDREHYSLKYYPSGKGHMTMDAYVDANFMGDHDSRSVTGEIIFSGNGILHWTAKRQPTIATSTPHAETNAFFNAVKSVIHTKSVLDGFGTNDSITTLPTIIYGDNSACIELTRKRAESINRTKHWQMQWNWLHEHREMNTFVPEKIGTYEMLADIFTKPMVNTTHHRFVKALRLDNT